MRVVPTSLRLLALLPLLWLGMAASASEEGFQVVQAKTHLDGDTYLLDARIAYYFSDTALDALDNGVPLTLEVRVQVRRAGAWIWEASLLDRRHLYLIRFQPLTEQYVVAALPDGEKKRFVTRDAAIGALGELEDLPLLPASRLDRGERYQVHIKTALDIEALPLPLRPYAYLRPSWHLSSGWSEWPLDP